MAHNITISFNAGVASTESDNGAKEEEQKLENGPAVKWGLWGYLRPNNEKGDSH